MQFLQAIGTTEYGIIAGVLTLIGTAFWKLIQKGIAIMDKIVVDNAAAIQKLVAEKDELTNKVITLHRETITTLAGFAEEVKKCPKGNK